MAQYWYDFRTLPNLDAFSSAGSSAVFTFAIVDDGGENALRVQCSANTNSFLFWPTDVTATNKAQVRVVARQGQHQNFRGVGLAVFAGGTVVASPTSQDFTCTGRSGTDERLYVDGSAYGSTSYVTATSYHNAELQRDGGAAEARWWTGDVLSDRPAAQLSATSTTNRTSGNCGLYGYMNNGNTYFIRTLAIGTDGDSAPTGPVGAPAEPEPLLWLPSQFRRMAIAGAAGVGGSHSTTGAASVTQPVASAGTSSQTHATAGAASAVAAAASAGASSQSHATTGQASVTQPIASAGTSSVSHATTGAASVVQPAAAAGQSAQTHLTAGAASAVRAVAASGTSQVGDTHNTTGAASILRAVAASATSAQSHITVGQSSIVHAAASSSASAQTHTTEGAASVVQAVASSSTSQADNTHNTVGAASVVRSIAAAGSSVHTHLTTGAPSVMASRASAGRSSDGTNVDLRRSLFVRVPRPEAWIAVPRDEAWIAVPGEDGVFVRLADASKSIRS